MSNMLAQFNAHQQDARNRITQFAQAIFVLSGIALSASIAMLTDEKIGALTPQVVTAVQISWGSLVGAVVVLVVSLALILFRDYRLGESWRKQLRGQVVDTDKVATQFDKPIIILGIFGVALFVVGFLSLGYVIVSMVTPA